MKILIVSLLRLGDIVLTAPIIKALREKYPHAQIDLLINSQFASVTRMISGLNRVHHFDRDLLQKGLGEARVPLFDSFERLEAQLDELNSYDYDQVINLTHNRLSGWLVNLISAKSKLGLTLDSSGRASFGSEWFRFLNQQVDVDGAETFHFTDIFRLGLGLEDRYFLRPALSETPSGRNEVQNYLHTMNYGPAPIVAVQVFTSDTKKDWGIANWLRSLTDFAQAHPEARIALLAAPNESDRLKPLLHALKDLGVHADSAVLSLEGAYSLLKQAKLLITGDTSIKHLASAARTPIVEICLGSSDAMRTGAYMHGAVIMRTRESCAPCVHSRPCHRSFHACAAKMSADAVTMVASEVYAGRTFQLATIAEEFKNEVEILQVDARTNGYWTAPNVLEPLTAQTVGRWIDLTSKKIWLSHSENVVSEAATLGKFLKGLHPSTSEIEWRHLLGDFERQAEFVQGRIVGLKASAHELKSCFDDPKKMRDYARGLIGFRERIKQMPLLKTFTGQLDQIIEDDISPAFTKFRHIAETVSEIDRRTTIHLGLIRGLELEFETIIHNSQGAERA